MFKKTQSHVLAEEGNNSNVLATLGEGEHIKITHRGGDFVSIGWRFHASVIFNYPALLKCLSQLALQRFKGFFITDAGAFGYNFSDGVLTEYELDGCLESRIEGIEDCAAAEHLEALEPQLLACLATDEVLATLNHLRDTV